MKATLHFDGSSKPNKRASYGYSLNSVLLTEITDSVPLNLMQTNNVAEYMGLIAGLKKAIKLGISDLEIVGDSKLVIYQVEGRYKCRAKHLKPLLNQAKELLNLMPNYSIRWIPREKNIADKLSR